MNNVMNYYNSFDEWGRLDREPLEYMVNMHHIQSLLPDQGHILDNGAGPGKYSIALAELGYQVTLTDLTPRLVEIAKSKSIERGLEERFNGFYTEDARDLSRFPDNHFDASLMMGPLYHLQKEEDRLQAVKELHRVTRSGGIVFVAFMTRTRFLMTSLQHPEAWKPHHSAEAISDFMRSGLFNHQDTGRFTGAYYFDIPDIQPFMERQGFETVKLVGSSSTAGSLTPEQWDYWKSRGEEEYRKVLQMIMEESENPYNLGVSSHLLYVGRRR